MRTGSLASKLAALHATKLHHSPCNLYAGEDRSEGQLLYIADQSRLPRKHWRDRCVLASALIPVLAAPPWSDPPQRDNSG